MNTKTSTIIKQPALSLLALSICSSFASATELNTAFLQGTTDVPSVLKDGVKYPAGQYYVDVSLNGTRTGRSTLVISPEDEQAGQLCLSPEWLQNAGIFFKPQATRTPLTASGAAISRGKRTAQKSVTTPAARRWILVFPRPGWRKKTMPPAGTTALTVCV